jgi:hypothetical protein
MRCNLDGEIERPVLPYWLHDKLFDLITTVTIHMTNEQVSDAYRKFIGKRTMKYNIYIPLAPSCCIRDEWRQNFVRGNRKKKRHKFGIAVPTHSMCASCCPLSVMSGPGSIRANAVLYFSALSMLDLALWMVASGRLRPRKSYVGWARENDPIRRMVRSNAIGDRRHCTGHGARGSGNRYRKH